MLICIGLHISSDRSAERALKKTQEDLVQVRIQLKLSQENLLSATNARDSVLKAAKEAELQREQIQTDLSQEIQKLRDQKPPSDCKKAIDWAVQNKSDLNWK